MVLLQFFTFIYTVLAEKLKKLIFRIYGTGKEMEKKNFLSQVPVFFFEYIFTVTSQWSNLNSGNSLLPKYFIKFQKKKFFPDFLKILYSE